MAARATIIRRRGHEEEARCPKCLALVHEGRELSGMAFLGSERAEAKCSCGATVWWHQPPGPRPPRRPSGKPR